MRGIGRYTNGLNYVRGNQVFSTNLRAATPPSTVQCTPAHLHTHQPTHTLMALVCGNRRCLCVRLLFVFQINHTPRIRGAVEINRMRSQKQFQRICAIQQLKPDTPRY